MDQNALLENKIKRQAEQYHERFRDQMDALGKSPLAKVRTIDAYEAYALGKQLEQFDFYKQICEEQGNVNLLGKIPDIAYDVITAVHGASIIPVIASVQPIEEERGTVYFKNIRYSNVKGNILTANEVVLDPRKQVKTPAGYSNAAYDNFEAVSATVAGTTVYNFTLPAFPIKSESLVVVTDVSGVEGKDVGGGRIFGIGISGTVNYLTGAVSVEFTTDPGAGKKIFVSFQQNYELSADIPQMDVFFDSKGLAAKIYALKGTVGLLQSFGMSKRFGLAAEDEMARDLVQEVNREIGGDLIRKLKAAAAAVNPVPATFSKAAPSGVSYFEHKQAYKDSLAVAEGNLVLQAGRGTVTVIIAGLNHCNIIQTLPGFVKLYDGNGLGAHIFGTLDGVTVIRVSESALLGADEALCIWKGLSPFETAAIYAPYMPLTVTGTLPLQNPLTSQKAAAVWAGVDSVVPNFVTRFNLIP